MKANKLGRIKETIIFGRALRATLAASAIFVMAFVLVPYVVSEASAANQASAGVAWTSVSLTLNPDYDASNAAASWAAVGNAGHGDVDFGSFIPSSVGDGNLGTQKVVKKTIAVETNGREYQVFLSTADGTDALTLSGGGTTIDAMGGTWSTPAAFSGKGWGYAVPSVTGHTTAFSAASVYANYDSLIAADTQITKASHSSIYNTGTWAAVPKLTVGAQQIWKASTNNLYGFGGEHGDATEDKFNIYYSAIVDTSLVAGEYTNNIIYTALASSSTIDSVSNNLARSQEYIFGGDTEKITFNLAMSTPTISASQVKVYLVPHSVVHANRNTTTGEYTDTGLSGYKTSTYECGSITNFSVTDKEASLTCTVPSNPAGTTAGGSSMAGEYDIYLTIDVNDDGTADYKYVSQYTRNGSETGTVMYAGLHSTDRSGNLLFNEMQDITPSICKNTNRWGAGLGSSAALYNYTGSGSTIRTGVPSYSSTVGQTTGGDLGTGSFALKDNRDDKLYLVRRLADGNCWMVQNLDLNLASFAGSKKLTPTNTDLNSTTAVNRGYYDPQEKLLTAAGTTSVATALNTKYGAAQTAQFTSGQQRNTDASPQYHWGSTKNTSEQGNSATTSSGTTVYNSDDAAFARSYDNVTWGYVPTNQTDGSQTQTIANLTTRSGTDGLNSYKTSGWASLYANQYVGDYYNWYAATAESGTWNMQTESVAGSAEDSICPKGWQLPYDTIGSGKSWYDLIVTAYKQNTNNGDGSGGTETTTTSEVNIKKFPLSLVRSGNYNWADGNLYDRGSYGNFWSSTPYAVTSAHDLEFWGGNLYPRDGDTKAYGLTVRCVAR